MSTAGEALRSAVAEAGKRGATPEEFAQLMIDGVSADELTRFVRHITDSCATYANANNGLRPATAVLGMLSVCAAALENMCGLPQSFSIRVLRLLVDGWRA